MNETMIYNWNLVAGPKDEIIHDGDFIFGGIEHAEKILSRLNGHITLIRGNHDKKLWKYYLTIPEKITTCDNFSVGSKAGIIYFSHYPEDVRNGYTQHKKKVQWHVHGHIHQHPTPDPKTKLNISVEHINYTPVLLDDIINSFYGCTDRSAPVFETQ
jgi:calcineurin-like phosphoesterase family protein